MLKISTGLRNAMLDTATLRTALGNGFVKIYSGAAPGSADAAVTGTLLCVISDDTTGVGISLAPAAGGSIAKTPTEVWAGNNVASGTAGYYRHVASTDTGTASITEPRVQGAIATSGSELNLTSVVLSNGATQTVDFYSITLPTL